MTDMACYIFGAGDFDGLEERPGAEDYVIAADGFLWASLVMTVYSGVEYVWKNKSVFSM